jgi:ribose 5-phosphate isomerase B
MSPKAFQIITEADARRFEIGAVVELVPGGHVTPLAQDTLRARRVTVVRAGTTDSSLPVDLAPPADIRRVAIGSDHTGVQLKHALVDHLRRKGLAVEDVWPESSDRSHDPVASARPIDYPDVAAAVGLAVTRGQADAGIAIDGAGLGSAIAANKIRGVRAAMCPNVTLARYAREHNGANVLALGATLVTIDEARDIVDTWIATPMTEARYIRRLLKIQRLERPDGG